MAYQKAIDTKLRTDTIILGFRIGMSKNESINYAKNLISEKVAFRESNSLYYNLLLSETKSNLKLKLVPEFYNNQLYRLGISGKCTDCGFTNKNLLQNELFLLIIRKYGVINSFENEDTKSTITNNLLISVRQGILDDVQIWYEDIPLIEKAKKENEADLKKKIELQKNIL